MGFIEGLKLGSNVEDELGERDSSTVGGTVSLLLDGATVDEQVVVVGFAVGTRGGGLLGFKVGETVGFALGTNDGNALGAKEGALLGLADGLKLGTDVGGELGK